MRFLVTGKLNARALLTDMPREEYLQQLRGRVIPTLQMLLEQQHKGTVMGGGVIPLDTLVFLVDLPGEGMGSIRRLLWSLPAFDLFEWDVKPLESFEELVTIFDPNK